MSFAVFFHLLSRGLFLEIIKATVRVRVRALLVVWPPLTYIELRVRVRGYD